jgi:predicted regulator of Ras-like GTPase activity (Roadblock/LC7/MglB family)
MDAASALSDLTEISSQVDAAVVFGEDGTVVASTFGDETRTERLARIGRSLLEAADEVATGSERKLTRLEVVLPAGTVFVARGEGSGSSIVATTGPAPESRLVFHDLATCLRAVAEADEQSAPKARRTRKKKPVDA